MMKQLWYACCHWVCARVYYSRITALHPERLPDRGPVLYIALHRNGAVDGFIYRQVVPKGVFLVSTQLLRTFFSRLFFCGIAVARKHDAEDQSQNEAALAQCTQLLAHGGELIVFPEGTSSLGSRHLPFKSGAASIALSALEQGIPLRIVPLGIHYERAWDFRSKVEVVVGNEIPTELPDGLSQLGKLKEMKRRMKDALESVGANFASSEAQECAEQLAYAATLGTPLSYFDALKQLEAGTPEALVAGWQKLRSQLISRCLLFHQGVPLFPVGPWIRYALLLLVLGPIALAAVAINFPPLLAGWLAARRLADDRNVIALWRILVGLPLFVIWFGFVTILLAFHSGYWAIGYVFLTFAALQSIYRAKKIAVAVWNGLTHKLLARRVHEFHGAILQSIRPA